jgi:hypothetical protein
MNKTIFIAILIVSAVSTSFYWFGVRPGEVRKDCWESSQEKAGKVIASENNLENQGYAIAKKASFEKVRDDRYKACLLEHGLAR